MISSLFTIRSIRTMLVAAVLTTTAFAWGPATHTYIAGHVQLKDANVDQLYGATAPDINLLLSAAGTSPYFEATHYGFMNVWNAAEASNSRAQKSLAFGFVTHNEKWGADHTAHIRSLAYPNYKDGGYVIKKSQELCQVLTAQFGSQVPPGILTTDNCHFILEYGIDLMMKSRDKNIGAKVGQAARLRSPEMANLLMAAFPDVDPNPPAPFPAGVTYGAEFAMVEPVWREKMAQYGDILNLPNEQAVPALAAFLNQMAHDLNVLPAEMDATILIQYALLDSMQVCAPDLGTEINRTILSVDLNLLTHGIYRDYDRDGRQR